MRKYYKKRYKRSSNQVSENKLLFISREQPLIGCWRFERAYQSLDRKFVYSDFASGEGPITRHLCGDNRCINPLHLVKGTDLENAQDEIVVRDHMVKFLQDMIGENYDEYPKDLAALILLPRARRLNNDMFKTMSELALHTREFYRRNYVNKLISIKDELDLSKSNAMLIAIKRRNDISIVNE